MTDFKLDKDFWNDLRNTPNYNDFEIYIVTKLVCGEDLSNFNEKKIFTLVFDMAMTNGVTENDLKIKIKKFKQSIPIFLEKLSSIYNQVEKDASKIYQIQRGFIEKANSLPEYGLFIDSDEVLEFISKLDQDTYSFSQAEKLLGVTRQTLKKYADEGIHGIKTIRVKKSDYITKESMANFYREQWENEHGSPF